MKERRFEFLDSLNKPGSPDAIRVFRRMVKNIKRAWKEGSSSSDEPLNPPTLDGFVLKHVIVPMQPKLRCSIEKLKPPRFKYIDEARKIKDLVLSKEFVTKYHE